MEFTYLLPVSSQPRFWKRINALTHEGCAPVVLTFERPYFEADPATAGRFEVIGSLHHGKYLRRVFAFTRALIPVLLRSRSSDVLYCFGTDLIGLGIAAKLIRRRLRLVVEIGDIRPVMVDTGVAGRVLRAVERMLLRRAALIVVTSAAYRDHYFVGRQQVPARSILVIENKVDEQLREPMAAVRRASRTPTDILTIGYYGLIRCNTSWRLLEGIALALPERFRVEAWGRLILDPGIDLKELPANMSYHGEYRNPQDLAAMLSRFDLVWVGHKHAHTNTHWARANRFYEACGFAKPMICQADTQDGIEVDRLGVGVTIDLDDPDAALRRLASVTNNDVTTWQERLRLLNPEVYRYAGEHAELVRMLR
jgi:succinoglycan biosynthesis protein ExoL